MEEKPLEWEQQVGRQASPVLPPGVTLLLVSVAEVAAAVEAAVASAVEEVAAAAVVASVGAAPVVVAAAVAADVSSSLAAVAAA